MMMQVLAVTFAIHGLGWFDNSRAMMVKLFAFLYIILGANLNKVKQKINLSILIIIVTKNV